ncbi:hypothetical protein [Winogradskyella sp.]|uniref:hypothetical protein n=1 Tax=Winogradskyella sp. TaxID=1883156 RepID=UPI001B02F5D7|nr:hypothetical protein [Winogradskyella sp.]MBO6880438.1 hypothetical protein [Winogradskyella sp.]
MKNIFNLILLLFFLASCGQKANETNDNKPENFALTNQTDLFEFKIPDTISLGKHIGRITKYKRNKKPNYDYLLSVIVSNQYEGSKIKTDTFSNGTLNPFFGINGFKTGTQEITLIIEEQIIEPYEKDKDSFLGITKLYHNYESRITVVDGDYMSETEKELRAELKNK